MASRSTHMLPRTITALTREITQHYDASARRVGSLEEAHCRKTVI